MSAFVCIVELRLHFGESQDLKGKRKQLQSLKTLLRQRFGASVAEVGGQDTCELYSLICALFGGREIEERADALERFAESRCPDGCAVQRDLRSLRDIRD